MTYQELIDEIKATFYTAYQANAPGILSPFAAPDILWEGVQIDEGTLSKSEYHVRFDIFPSSRRQTGLRNHSGLVRYTCYGLISIVLLLPKFDRKSFERGQNLAVSIRNSLSKHSADDNVWFKDANVVKLSETEAFTRLQVSSKYEFDEEI